MSEEARPKRRRWWIVLLLLLAFMFLLPIIGAVALVKKISEQQTEIVAGSVLSIHLGGDIPEAPQDPILARFGGGKGGSVWELREALTRAATDDRIAAVMLTIEPVSAGWAACEEVVAIVDTFRASGKPVHAWIQLDLMEEKEYFLATAADRIWTSPGTAVIVNGLAAEVTFFRGTLDKLKVEPEVIMFHEYKSAGEQFQNKEMSPYFREALGAVMEDIQARFIARVVERRGVPAERLTALMDKGMVVAQEAVDAGLIDQLGFETDIQSVLRGLAKTDGASTGFESVSLSDYAGPPDLAGLQPPTDQIAVIFAEGPIFSGSGGDSIFGDDKNIFGPRLAAKIAEAVEDPKVKAIVMRVSSPGGSAVGSDFVWKEIQRAHEAGKPFIVSMSTVAGSGGYWISMGADAIVARPTTITGSIGVVFQKFNVTGLMDMLGAHNDTVSLSPNSDLFSLTAPLTPERRVLVEGWMQAIYTQFITKVSEGRHLPVEKVQQIAKGRIWSGTDALELGLVDKLGGLDEAIALAREKGGIGADVPAKPYPTPEPFFQRLLSGDLEVRMDGIHVPSQAEVVDLLTELSRPEVRAEMPSISVH